MKSEKSSLAFRVLVLLIVILLALSASNPPPSECIAFLCDFANLSDEEITHILLASIPRHEQERPDQPDEAMQWRLMRMRDEQGNIPDGAQIRAAEQVKQRLGGRRASQIAGVSPTAWTWRGPSNVGGRIRAIAVHPTTTTTIFVGTAGGGIWKSTDGGSNWANINDFLPSLAVTSIIFDPTNLNVMYASTGEGFGNCDSMRGAGIFKSTDGGTTWNQLASTNNLNFYFVNRLAISPDGSTILAATRSSYSGFCQASGGSSGTNGIWRSTNGGASWTQVSTAQGFDVVFGSNTRAVAGSSGTVYYSNDGGATWFATSTSFGAAGRVEVAFAPTDSNVVYASVYVNSGEIWQSLDGAVTFTRKNTGTSYCDGQCWYDLPIWVDPTITTTLVVGGIDLWKSTNSGTTLTQISKWQCGYPYSCSGLNSAHADHHAIVNHPNFNGSSNTTVYFGNDGGFFSTSNVYTVGNNPPNYTAGWVRANNGLGVTQFYGGAGNPSSGKITGGTQDNGTWSFDGVNWVATFGGDGGYAAYDPNDSNYQYGEYVYLQIHRNTTGGSASSSYIWNTPSPISDAASGTTALFIAPFTLDRNNPNTMWAGGRSLWRSQNVKAGSPAWSNVKTGGSGVYVSAIAVAPGNSNVVWVGYTDGRVYKTTNGTQATPTWTTIDDNSATNPLPNPSRYITRIVIDPTNSNNVYVALGSYNTPNLYKTTNGGGSFNPAAGSGGNVLPTAPVYSLAMHPYQPSWLYAGTDVGLFTSEDGGANWNVPQDGPAILSIDDLQWMGKTLIVTTHGRGIFTAAIPSPFFLPFITR